jgi:hypothetical protein
MSNIFDAARAGEFLGERSLAPRAAHRVHDHVYDHVYDGCGVFGAEVAIFFLSSGKIQI